MNLHNKTLIVTGVASGIGAELARLAPELKILRRSPTIARPPKT